MAFRKFLDLSKVYYNTLISDLLEIIYDEEPEDIEDFVRSMLENILDEHNADGFFSDDKGVVFYERDTSAFDDLVEEIAERIKKHLKDM